ncbi:alpha/beta-hydrolase [Polyporus arcularius HHB13444]|uniref:Alpha/beta-hydrolase n=1 Tax=Polyporus arcularius HHB13444 TaxID=1314778 RepID=A0A5C3NYE5_9APHY|nr:alpha/beta-hydrolase [Polyporus arcularius HHB13444]
MSLNGRSTGWKHQLGALVGLYLQNSTANVSPVQGNIGDVVWGSCSDNTTLPGAECGYAIVPLDYFNSSAGVAKIALGRYNATSTPRKGSLFVNPGGPGASGVSLATVDGGLLQQVVGEEYDIIGFDPRGIGLTEPATKCFPTPEARTAFIANTVIDRGYDVGPNLADPSNRYHLIQTQRDADALYKTQFAICGQTMGDQLRYMGTSTVTRDVDFMTTLLDGKDALINFWGFSYGTVIGQYLANMFPERIGRVIIDGVVDANAWANKPAYTWYRTWLSSTEGAYKIFFEDCAKSGPSGCALAQSSKDSATDIYNRVEDFVNKLYDEPLPVPNATIPGILTSGRARLFWIGALASPSNWPHAAEAFAAAMAGDASAVMDAVNQKELVDLERSAVSCNDNKPFALPKPEDVIDEALFVQQHVTRFGLTITISEPDSGCQYWPVTPPERYLGPWNSTTKNPILIISNTNDPATPISSGEIVHKALGNSSAFLVLNAPGHTSFAAASTCIAQNTRAFFANGTLPAKGTICQPNSGPFPEQAANSTGAIGAIGSSKALASSDDQLLASLRHIGAHILGKGRR